MNINLRLEHETRIMFLYELVKHECQCIRFRIILTMLVNLLQNN